MVAPENPEVSLLAIDLGLRFGWAAFTKEGRLNAYGSRHFGSRSTLRQAVPPFLRPYPSLTTLVIEGGGDLLLPWKREAGRRNISFLAVSGETWREKILPPRERRTGKEAKAAADGLARKVIADSGAKRPTSLRHDAAEAILVGYWAVTSRR